MSHRPHLCWELQLHRVIHGVNGGMHPFRITKRKQSRRSAHVASLLRVVNIICTAISISPSYCFTTSANPLAWQPNTSSSQLLRGWNRQQGPHSPSNFKYLNAISDTMLSRDPRMHSFLYYIACQFNKDTTTALWSNRIMDDRRDDDDVLYDDPYDPEEDDLDDEYYGNQEYENDDNDLPFDNVNDEDDLIPDKMTRSANWEACDYGNTQVLLPTSSRKNNEQGTVNLLPKAIIHFIGGTGFGTLHRLSYGPFLQQLSDSGHFIIVSTPPLSSLKEIVTTSPLNHYRIAMEMTRGFNHAYKYIIEDEFGVYSARRIPIVGLGHSLGSKLHLILNMNDKMKQKKTTGTTKFGYHGKIDGNVLMSFNNFPARKSIPFLYELGVLSKRTVTSLMQRSEDESVQERGYRNVKFRDGTIGDRRENDWTWSENNRRKVNKRRPSTNEAFYYDDNDMTLETLGEQIANGMGWLSDTMVKQLSQFSTTLEFSPAPSELFDLVRKGKYTTAKTLLVQFDNDSIDQSSALARELLRLKNETDGQNDVASKLELKFARLKGNHLTPILRTGTNNEEIGENTFSSLYPKIGKDGNRNQNDVNKVDQVDALVSCIVQYVHKVICIDDHAVAT